MSLIHFNPKVLDELQSKEENCRNLQTEIEDQYRKAGVARHQMGLLYEEYDLQKKEWANTKGKLESKINSLEDVIESGKARISEYEASIETLSSKDPDQIKTKLSDATRKIAILKSNEAMMIRRYKAMEDSEVSLRKECSSLKDEIVDIENSVIEKLGSLQRYKDMASYKIESLQKSLVECVPGSTLEKANRQLSEITANYRDLLQREQAHSSQGRRIEELEMIIEGLKDEKSVLSVELKVAKEKLVSCESLMHRVQSKTKESPPGSSEQITHQVQSLAKQVRHLQINLGLAYFNVVCIQDCHIRNKGAE